MADFHVLEGEIPKIFSDSKNLKGFEFVTRLYWTLEALVGYLVPFCPLFIRYRTVSLANLIFNIQVRSEDERVPTEYDNFCQLERPNRPTRFTTDRATDPTDRDAFLNHS